MIQLIVSAVRCFSYLYYIDLAKAKGVALRNKYKI